MHFQPNIIPGCMQPKYTYTQVIKLKSKTELSPLYLHMCIHKWWNRVRHPITHISTRPADREWDFQWATTGGRQLPQLTQEPLTGSHLHQSQFLPTSSPQCKAASTFFANLKHEDNKPEYNILDAKAERIMKWLNGWSVLLEDCLDEWGWP